ncbi:MAG: ankyrin repeat domain-containing protein [Rickettsia sp.]|nr:ankyrin repeat domain-containing protein [Rickettsia sp.]
MDKQNNKNIAEKKDDLKYKLTNSDNKKSISDNSQSFSTSSPKLGTSTSKLDNGNDFQIKESKSTNAIHTAKEIKKFNEEFLEAVSNNDSDAVIKILQNPLLDVNVRRNTEGDNMSPLEIATSNQKIEIVKAILEHKNIDIDAANIDGKTVLSRAMDVKSIEIIEMLFEKSPNLLVTDECLNLAARKNYLFFFKILLEKHEDKNFLKNHALKIFEKAGSFLNENEGYIRIDFLEFIIQKLIEQTSPKEALEICVKSIPFFGKYEESYKYIFVKYFVIPPLKKELSKKEIITCFDKVISDAYSQHQEYRRSVIEIEHMKEYLLENGYSEKESIFLNGDHSII